MNQPNEPLTLLAQLGLEPSESEVYLAMTQGAASVKEIIQLTQRQRPTVYYALGQLEHKGLVSKTGHDYSRKYQLEPLERLAALAHDQQQAAEQLSDQISSLISNLSPTTDQDSTVPSVSFFEGEQAVKNVVLESLYCRQKLIYVIAPRDNFFWQMGEDFVRRYVEERNAAGIAVHSLWDNPISPAVFVKYYGKNAQVRLLPTVMRGHFKTTIFIYDNKTLYISSKNESTCLLVQSKEHCQTMHALFAGLWANATKHQVH